MAESSDIDNLWKSSLIVSAALEAGKIGMHYFQNKETDIWYKSGNSPVSQADREIDQFLREHLLNNTNDHAWLSEETEDNSERLKSSRLFIVDPIDGTRGFIAGKKEWCVSIAMVEDGRPVEGVLHNPALNRTIYARKGLGLFMEGLQPQTQRHAARPRPRVAGSKKLMEDINRLPGNPMDTIEYISSLAYRLSLVADGTLDAAFARQGASEWDIAATDIILEEAGCMLSDRNGREIRYNKQNVASPALIATPISQQREILDLVNTFGFLH